MPLLRQMLDGAHALRIDDPRFRDVHARAIAGAQLHVRGFEMLVEALDQDDQRLTKQASAPLRGGERRMGEIGGRRGVVTATLVMFPVASGHGLGQSL